MLRFSSATPVFVVHGHVDFRSGLERLCGLVRSDMQLDPQSGPVFVFRNKKAHSIELVFFDGSGMWLCCKRLSNGKFRCWPESNDKLSVLHARDLLVLLWGGDPSAARFQKQWKPLVLP